MKHTKGPWRAMQHGDYCDFDGDSRVIIGDDRRIAVVQVQKHSKEDNANATMIAACPVMFDALELARAEIAQYAKDLGPCDHSVNICYCSTHDILGEVCEAIVMAGGKI